jgi:hypothetical protein
MASRSETRSLLAELTDLFRTLSRTLTDGYRPELHYMRGPGPRWRAKHTPAKHTPARHTTVAAVAHPALAYVRAAR